MQLPRKYTAAEIKELVDTVRNTEDFSQEKIEGMDMLVEMLDKFSKMTEAEMEEYGRSAYRVLRKDEILRLKERELENLSNNKLR